MEKFSLNAIEIAGSEVDGLTEVVTDRGLFYFTDDGKYLIHGNVYDVSAQVENITERSYARFRLAAIKEFENAMIVFPASEEKHVVTVFTDVSCGYCRKLHDKMPEYNELGITVRYLAFPRAGTSGSTFKEMSSIWCAVDQNTALTKAKNGDRTPQEQIKECNTPVAEHYALGLKFNVKRTPAMVLEDGRMIPGYLAPTELLTKYLAD